MGKIAIINDTLRAQGLKEGDTVCYKPFQEYEFKVDGEILWRMYDHSITLKI
jgi:co-chaperonin GroES (HSP10)